MPDFLFFYALGNFPSRAVVVDVDALPNEALEELSYITSFGEWAYHDREAMQHTLDTLKIKGPNKPTDRLYELLHKWSLYCEDSPAFWDCQPEFIQEAHHHYLLKDLNGISRQDSYKQLKNSIKYLAGSFFYQS